MYYYALPDKRISALGTSKAAVNLLIYFSEDAGVNDFTAFHQRLLSLGLYTLTPEKRRYCNGLQVQQSSSLS
jgi:hypothetical protein